MTSRKKRQYRLLERAELAVLEANIKSEIDDTKKNKLIEQKKKLEANESYRERMNYGI